MANCPECRKTLYPNQKKCTCGWRAEDAKAYRNPRHGLCEYNDHGMMCNKAGSIALHTGEGGPWYCSEHALGLKGMAPKKIGTQSIKDHIESVNEKMLERQAIQDEVTGGI